MEKPLEEYGERIFTEAEVREKLSEVITDTELIDEFTNNYTANHAHLHDLFSGQHHGEEWEQWEYSVEDERLADGEAIVRAGQVVWNNLDADLEDEVVDARLSAVIVHSLLFGFDNGWYDLYDLLDSAVDEKSNKFGLAKDILLHPELKSSVEAILSSLKHERRPSVIDQLMPLVEVYAKNGNVRACRRMRDFNVAKKDHDEIMRWTRMLQEMH